MKERRQRIKKLFALVMAGVILANGQCVAAAEENMPFQTEDPYEAFCGYVDLEEEVHSVSEYNGEPAVEQYVALPVAYDSRDYGAVSSVKNQNPWGNCWSFATMAAAESSLLSADIYDEVDLSEYHLCYYNYKTVTDPLGGTAGDSISTSNDLAKHLNAGNNTSVAFHALTNWVGAVDESVTGYPLENPPALAGTVESAYMEDIAHVQHVYKLAPEDTDAIKQVIMEHGAVTASMYHSSKYMNKTTGGYYNNNATKSNHAVTVVGWDDNYSRDNFNTKPSKPGAWLVKNSWGTNWGKDGYFWISYEDVITNSKPMYAIVAEKADNYDRNYQYDGSYYNTNFSGREKYNVANVFHVPQNSPMEILKAVAFEVGTTNATYSIQIYKNLSNKTNPTSGTPLLEQPVTGTAVYQGYHTIKLPKPIKLKAGDEFAVVVKFYKAGGAGVPIETSKSWSATGLTYTAKGLTGQSFIDFGDSGRWWDTIQQYGGNTRVKAFTDVVLTDVAVDSWQYPYVSFAYERGIMNGKSATYFGVNDALTRSEFATILYAYSGKPACTYRQIFGDVKESDWFGKSVTWAYDNGVVSGYNTGLFGSEDPITREQLILMLYKFAGTLGWDMSYTKGNLNSYADKSKISGYAYDAMDWAVYHGLITGNGSGLNPGAGATRGECATIMSQFWSVGETM